MSQGTFLDTLIQLEAFKGIFVFRRKIDFFLRICRQKLKNFVDVIF